MYRDLSSFIAALDEAGELARIRERVDPVLEMGAIADLESKRRDADPGSRDAARTDPEFHRAGGRALLFENPIGSDFPVLINAFGSYKRMEMALGGRSLERIASRIGALAKPEPPRTLGEALAKARQFAPLLKIGPKRSKDPGACQQVVREGEQIDLTKLPIMRCWPLDGDFASFGYPEGLNAGVRGAGHPEIGGEEWEARWRGRFITLAGVHTIHAEDRDDPKPKSHNIGMYRVQLIGKDRLAMHWHMHHDGAAHWRSWKRLGEPMPVAIALGGPSVLPYGATCPLPPGISELLMAGFLQGRGVRLCRAATVPLWVPAESEIVIEGFVRTDAGFPGWDPMREDADPLGEGAVFEGPFGDHTGFYSMPDRYPLVEVRAVTHRRDAVYPATVVGLPIQEDYFLGKATERIMLPLLKTILPDIEDYDLPVFGAFHNAACIKIKKHYPLHARKVMHGVWGAGQMAWTKTLFLVDDDVDVHDLTSVLDAVCRRCNPSRDIERVHGAVDILDHAAARFGASCKFGFDATRKVPSEDIDGAPLGEEREPPTREQRDADAEAARSVDGVLDAHASEHAPGWLFVRVDRGYGEPEREGLGRRVLGALTGRGLSHPFVVALGRGVDITDQHGALFHWVANTDFDRDTLGSGGSLFFDATPKTAGDAHAGHPVRAWPPVLVMDDGVLERARMKRGD